MLPNELKFESLQRIFHDPKFFYQVKLILELLGSAKSASQCHAKMLLMAFMLQHHRTLLKPTAGSSTSAAASGGITTNGAGEYFECECDDPDYELGRNVCDPSLYQLIDILGRAWVGVCNLPTCWFKRMRFMVSYARYSKAFLEWKARDSREMVEVEVLRFVDAFTTMNNMRQVVVDGYVPAYRMQTSLEWARKACEHRLRNLTSLLGSANKARELIREELLRYRLMVLVSGKLGIARGEPLVFFEWSDDRKLVDHWKVRLAALSTAECGAPAASGSSRRIAVPRVGSRHIRYSGDGLLRQWWGPEYGRLVRLKQHISRGMETGSQIGWVPLFVAHVMRVMTAWVIRDKEKAKKFALPIDSEFVAQQCAMNQCHVIKYISYFVTAMKEFCALPRIEEINNIEKRFLAKGELLQLPLLFAFLDLLENLRVDACMPSLHAAVQSLAHQPPNNELYAFVNDLNSRRMGLRNALRWIEIAKKDSEGLADCLDCNHNAASRAQSVVQSESATSGAEHDNDMVVDESIPSVAVTKDYKPLDPSLRLERLQLYLAKMLTQLPSSRSLTALPETLVMLHLPILNLQMLVRDTVLAFAICQYSASLGNGDAATICRLKSSILTILGEEHPQTKEQVSSRIHAAIENECFCLCDNEKRILYSLIDSLMASDEALLADKVAKVARARICRAVQHMLVHGSSAAYDGPKLDNFACDVANICRQAEHIWEASYDTYKPIYEVLLEYNKLWRCRLK
jgi:hypothetical protein